MTPLKKQRLAILKMMLALLKIGHTTFFSSSRLGSSLQLLLVFGLVANAPSAGRRATISYVAKELQLPRETARRLLSRLADQGRIRKHGREYLYVESSRTHAAVQEAIELVKRTASKL